MVTGGPEPVTGGQAQPLRGVRVLVPRPPHQASALSDRVRALGGEPVEAATIRTVAGDADALAAAVTELAAGGFVGACLTSVNGAVALAEACAAAGVAPDDAVAPLRWLAAVGPRTAAVVAERFGRDPEVVPARSTGADLGAALPTGEGRVLLPRGDLARAELTSAVEAAGYVPVAVVAYRTVPVDALPDDVRTDLTSGAIDLVAATAGSTVRALVALLGGRPPASRVVSIGPVTSGVCREHGVAVAAEADPHDLDGLLDALVRVAAAPR